MSDKKYYVIYIDDKCEEDPFFVLNAKKCDVIVKAFKYVKDGLSELKNNYTKYDAIILDVKCLYESDDEADSSSGFYRARRFISDLEVKTNEVIPCFVYSGQPDYTSNSEFENYLNGEKLYKKGSQDDKQIFEDIKTSADKRLRTKIRHKYLDHIGTLPESICSEMTSILSYIEMSIIDNPDVFNKMRAVLDWLMVQLNEYGLLAVKHTGANLNACSLYLCKKELSAYVPVHIQRSLHSCVEICNNGSHRIDIFRIVQSGQAPFLVRSTIFELLNLLKWYNILPKDEHSIELMKGHIATIPPDNQIEGILQIDDNGNYFCENCLLHKKTIEDKEINLGDRIRISKSVENQDQQLKEKYPRFTKYIDIQ